MGRMGNGYGSECHLLRWMGRHRRDLDGRVLGLLRRDGAAVSSVTWLDCGFDPRKPWPDAEPAGLDFIDDPKVREAWGRWWPRSGTPPTWDGVGQVVVNGKAEWLLVEAKAHVGEMKNSCGAEGAGLRRIEQAMADTKAALGAAADRNWLRGCYQYANRLAVLHFLASQGIRARLLLVYFVGERARRGWRCPGSPAEWETAIASHHDALGLPARHALSPVIHELFLPVAEASSYPVRRIR